MQEQRIERFARFTAHLVPDAITAAVVLTGLTGVLALILGNLFGRVMEAYHQGLWMLLPFTMQMTLIIVLSSALGSTPFFRRGIATLARIPATRNRIIMLAFLAGGVCCLPVLGTGLRAGTDHRDLLRRRSGEEGDPDRFSVSAGRDLRRGRRSGNSGYRRARRC